MLISISQLSYIQRVTQQCYLVWPEEKMSFVRSWSSTQCGNQPQGKVLWRSWLCNVHSAGKDNTWSKRQSSWPILRDQQSFQTEFDPYASPNRCYTRKICVLLWGRKPLKGFLHLSMIKPYLINSSINIPYSPPHYQKKSWVNFSCRTLRNQFCS